MECVMSTSNVPNHTWVSRWYAKKVDYTTPLYNDTVQYRAEHAYFSNISNPFRTSLYDTKVWWLSSDHTHITYDHNRTDFQCGPWSRNPAPQSLDMDFLTPMSTSVADPLSQGFHQYVFCDKHNSNPKEPDDPSKSNEPKPNYQALQALLACSSL